MTCACKGIRTCPICESRGKSQIFNNDNTDVDVYLYCPSCQKGWLEGKTCHPNHIGTSIEFPGIFIKQDFVSETEEANISSKIYQTPFVESQSGRRKQDFGPKVNFKKKKLKCGNFCGLPEFSKDLHDRMLKLDILTDFVPVEQCHLEYSPERGSSIDPHFDDFWVWGERLVTLNLLSDTVLYFVSDEHPNVEVQVPMFQRSLIVVYGAARDKWKHGIHRADVKKTRLAVTLRELSPEFSKGGKKMDEGKILLDIALTFKGQAVGTTTNAR
ncbi:hypothetical protein DPMN_015005 [Dreissena polymorpha]|uniref:Fe2OG dioxygenase domain-containing protein n=1 Tax=Dreissena polymorpha TaxID=45954 RepID=A0A9D4N8D7_DREPO|nr:hypothetical protein DPMN_015005 [Dreissena polymorpha]